MSSDGDVGLWPSPRRLQLGDGVRPWHRHGGGYVALVLDGGYREIGVNGRLDARPGTAIVHAPFDAHANHYAKGGARLLNLPLPLGAEAACLEVSDPERIVKVAMRSPTDAVSVLLAEARPVAVPMPDWPDLLAMAIRTRPDLRLGDWALANGLAPETLSRGFRRCYGITPKRFRSEVRVRNAVRLLSKRRDRLCGIAVACGFADQAHMTRAIGRATGKTPGALVRMVS